MNMNAGVKVYLYDVLDTVDNGNAHVVFSDPSQNIEDEFFTNIMQHQNENATCIVGRPQKGG